MPSAPLGFAAVEATFAVRFSFDFLQLDSITDKQGAMSNAHCIQLIRDFVPLGTGPDFCGAANWCQPKWGRCDSTVRVR